MANTDTETAVMVADTSLKGIFGPFLFYKQFHQNRPRLFLQRNLRTVIDSHKRALQTMHEQSGNSTPAANSSNAHSRKTNGINGVAHDRQTRSKTKSSDDNLWNFPASENVLNALIAGQIDRFELEVGAIRPLPRDNSQGGNNPPSYEENFHVCHGIPAWEIPCRVELQVLIEPPSQLAGHDAVVNRRQEEEASCVRQEVHEAMIRGYITSPTNDESRLQISMVEPVKFSASSLVAERTTSARDGELVQSWIVIAMFISSNDRADMTMLVEKIRGQTSPRYQPMGNSAAAKFPTSNSNYLTVQWRGTFADLGPHSHLLEMRHCHNMQAALLGHGLEVNVRLSPPLSESALEHHNAIQRQSFQHSLHAVARDEPMRAPREAVKLIYTLKSSVHEHEVKYDDYICPLCNEANLRSFDLLHLHLYHNHTLCQFKVNKTQRSNGRTSVFVVRILIEVPRVEHPIRRKDRDNDWHQPLSSIEPKKWRKSQEDEMAWLAPRAPFDAEKYQEGDESWFKKGYDMEPRPSISRLHDMQRLVKAKDPDKVLAIPERRRKRFRVPEAPEGLSFFRTVTKHPLREGELVSESDDDIDETWTNQKKSESLATVLKGPPVAIEFIGIFDEYMQTENLNGDIHVGDALVRFARYQGRLFRRRADLAKEFKKKACELYEDRIITEKILKHCSQFADEAERQANELALNTSQQPNGTSSSSDIGDSKPRTRASGRIILGVADDEMVIDDDRNARKNGDADADMANDSSMEDTVVVQPLEETTASPNGGAAKMPSMGCCTCGQPVDVLRYAICCANPVSALDGILSRLGRY